ncbi:hypothetical protein [Bradyrhizobium sp.]
MTLHTHRGTCQACGAKQAVDNRSGLVAKHGYKVAGFGFFNGVCQGAGHLPAESSVQVTYDIIKSCEAWAAEADRLAGLWRDGSLMVHMHTVRNGNKLTRAGFYAYHSVMMWGCADYTIAAERRNTAERQESEARQARSHAEGLARDVLPRLGKPLYPVSRKPAPRQFKTGEMVKTGNGLVVQLTHPRYGFSGSLSGWKFTFPNDPKAGRQYISIRELRKVNS